MHKTLDSIRFLLMLFCIVIAGYFANLADLGTQGIADKYVMSFVGFGIMAIAVYFLIESAKNVFKD